MTAKTDLPPVPLVLADVALTNGPTAAAAGDMSLSAFLDGVRRTAAGELHDDEIPYPLPVIRSPRCTRWRLADIRAWLIDRAARQLKGDAVIAQAKRASDAARAKAKAKASQRQGGVESVPPQSAPQATAPAGISDAWLHCLRKPRGEP